MNEWKNRGRGVAWVTRVWLNGMAWCVQTGAIALFEVMRVTGCLEWIVQGLKTLSAGNKVAEVFLISWAFVYLIEGASGFGKQLNGIGGALGTLMEIEDTSCMRHRHTNCFSCSDTRATGP